MQVVIKDGYIRKTVEKQHIYYSKVQKSSKQNYNSMKKIHLILSPKLKIRAKYIVPFIDEAPELIKNSYGCLVQTRKKSS